ncbi:MAG TPA: hypothetical protein DEA82_12385 [Flavobacteriaceae bacterium]|nr:hypothetical protein [Flavobacteriaceae bacterium]HBR54926.1 hypothetical protein [Flavobacteriaceae bacterium]
MNTVKNFLAIFLLVLLVSCGGGTDSQPANAKGFAAIEQSIKDKFGADAYYTNVNILHDASLGNMINVTVTEDPASLEMGEHVFSKHSSWEQNATVTIEIPEGTQAKDYMFQLDENINLETLGALVEQSVAKLTTEKNIDNPTLAMAFIKFPKNGDISKTEYTVRLEPKNGGTSFTFRYDLQGNFIEMDY